jgi:hypothetical protein
VYSYAQVESALAKVHLVDASAIGAFRGRINNLKRLGIVPSSGGRGKKISYEIQDVWRLAFFLELAQFGIDPAIMKSFFESCVPKIIRAFGDAGNDNHGIYFAFGMNIMTGSFYAGTKLTDETNVFSERIFDAPDISAENLERCLGSSRFALFNVTKLKRDIDRALAEVVPAIETID